MPRRFVFSNRNEALQIEAFQSVFESAPIRSGIEKRTDSHIAADARRMRQNNRFSCGFEHIGPARRPFPV